MIKVDLSTAVCVYLVLFVIVVLALWVFFGRKSGFRRVNPEEKFVWQCRICTFFYIDSQSEDISVCPRCGSYNSRKDEKKQEGGEKA
ncbi:MAG: hypothetical protein NTV07_02845 [Candidatus Omnitrophica bacterium]|nr:hypothetical protein [Candidatus Omnitrophota bacterium]